MLTMDLVSFAGENADYLLEFHQGVEKEGLRAGQDMRASTSAHPAGLGHKLTHPYITTDYAENLLEFVTPVFSSNGELLRFLRSIQTYALEKVGPNELIWPSSMPCLLPNEPEIPIADFGASHTGRLKSLYREGLGHRYGRSMQSIAGMHFNFSLSRELLKKLNGEIAPELSLKDFTDQIYFKLIRNFRRHSWLLSYLFGASPVVDENFLRDKKHNLTKLGKNTWGKEFATSLRMGGLGYTSAAQNEIAVCYNRLKTYVSTLESARKRSYPPYERIGVKVGGDYRQLNSNLLQIDNEFYSPLRPKRTARSGESALQALHQHGVEYIEVRLLDLNPFQAEGIGEEAIRFLQLFLAFCLLEESPVIGDDECEEIERNFDLVVNEGRSPKTLLTIKGQRIAPAEAAQELMARMEALAASSSSLSGYYRDSLEKQAQKIRKPELLLSSRVLESVSENVSFAESTLRLAQKHKEELLRTSIPEAERIKLDALAVGSYRQEQELARESKGSFDEFLKNYFEKINIEEYP